MTDSSSNSPSYPSICIPRTFSNITDRQVKNVFEQVFGLNSVERVDLIRRKGADGKDFQRVFVHFKAWPQHEEACRIREKLIKGNEIKLVYNEPWFWKCRASTSKKPSNPRSKRFTPYIDISDSDNEQEQEQVEGDGGAPTFPSPRLSSTAAPPSLVRCHTSSIANGEC